jgi:hypothetical protein
MYITLGKKVIDIFCNSGLSTRGTADQYSNIGGVLYGSNKTHVQLWAACTITEKFFSMLNCYIVMILV